MKKYFIGCLLLILFNSVSAQIVIDSSKSNFDIKYNRVARLTNAIGKVAAVKKGTINNVIKNDVVLLSLKNAGEVAATDFAGIFFDAIPDLKQGVAIWRYKSWNSWTKPVALTDATKMVEWDVQFFYWQYNDGTYGAAVPLSGNGFRTTLGSEKAQWGSKGVRYIDGKNITDVPGMAIAFGKEPYELFARIYKTALTAMGKGENLFASKKLPKPFKYIGWCTWNSSDMGKKLTEEHIIEGIKTFTDKKFPLGWLLVDDGWFQHENSQLQSLKPDPKKFPNGFKPIADRASKNLIDSERPAVNKRSFEEVWNQYVDSLIKGEEEEIEVKMRKVSFFITSISNKSVEFRKQSGGSSHTLSIGTLKRMYDAESVLEIQGLSSYYTPLLEKLLLFGADIGAKKERIEPQNYVIIIDEINRANISRVFGELITLIEPDKRLGGEIPLSVTLPSGDKFTVPSNLYIIGTMNTADKSIALLDIALRRRFEFEPMYPKYDIPGYEIYDTEILKKINDQIIKSKGHDFQIGHAYFSGENKDLISRMNKKVIPLLLGYYMNDEKEVKSILKIAGLQVEENS